MTYNFRVEMNYNPSLNYIRHLNGMEQIASITVCNDAPETASGIKLKLSGVPAFLESWYLVLEDIPAGGHVTVGSPDVIIDSQLLLSYNEAVDASYIVEILTADAGSEPLFKQAFPVKVLPYDMWSGSYRPELLASFVTPNDRRVLEIVARAGDRMGLAFDGYGSGTQAVRRFMKTIYEIIQEERITYCYPPANWESGQRVRMPGFTLANKVGCCIDMAVLYAACLEAASLNPVVMILEGHAIAGCWMKETSFPENCVNSREIAENHVRQGEILLVECTLMDNYAYGCAFDQACRIDETYFSKFEYMIDIFRARAGGIRPVPIQEIHGLGGGADRQPRADEAQTQETQVVREEDDDFNDMPEEPAFLDDIPENMTRMDYWERMLLDSTLRNPLLSMSSGKKSMPLMLGEGLFETLTARLKDGERFSLLAAPQELDKVPTVDALDDQAVCIRQMETLIENDLGSGRIRFVLTQAEMMARLKYLYSEARTFREETGSSVLYLAVGLLKWQKDAEDKMRLAPLVLLPADLERKTANTDYVLTMREDEWLINTTLFETLKNRFGITVPGAGSLPVEDGLPAYRKLFHTLRDQIKSRPGWAVLERAYVGLFSFAQYMQWRDLHDHKEQFAKHPFTASLIENHLVWKPDESFATPAMIDHAESAGELLFPVSADSSQMAAVMAAVEGKSFVMHGPPGTGKSQTITNMIANKLYRGESVLFIAKKMPALEVVQQRLKDIGLGPFCLELHTNKASRQHVLDQMQETLALKKRDHDPMFAQTAGRINKNASDIRRLTEALNVPQRCGLSLHALMGLMTRYAQAPDAVKFDELSASMVSRQELAAWESQIQVLQEITSRLTPPPVHPLRSINRESFNLPERRKLTQLTEDWMTAMGQLRDLAGQMREILALPDDDALNIRVMAQIAEIVSHCRQRPQLMISMMNSGHTFGEIVEAHQKAEPMIARKEAVLAKFAPRVFKVKADVLLGDLEAVEGKTGRMSDGIRKNILIQLQMYAIDGYKVDPDRLWQELSELKEAIEDRTLLLKQPRLIRIMYNESREIDWNRWLKIERLQQMITEKTGRLGLPEEVEAAVLEYARCCAMNLIDAEDIEADRELFAFVKASYEAQRSRTGAITGLTGYECGRPSDLLCTDEFEKTLTAWQEHYHELEAWCSYCKERENARVMGLSPVADAVDEGLAPEDILPAFYKAWSGAYVSRLVKRDPQLVHFSGLSFDQTVSKYRRLCRDFEEMSRAEILAAMTDRLPDTSAGSDITDFVMLQRAHRGAGAHLTIRQLFAGMPEAVRVLKPCMLMSPASVAQYIDPDFPEFDLVIIDEASQMQTCEAIGAIARGKAVVIAGDEQQLPPTDFFKKRREGGDLMLEDLESVLDDALALNMPQCYLNWHYRSAHESLITFSNVRYYDNRLHTFPSAAGSEPAVHFHLVDGVYARSGKRTNPIEAKAVVTAMEARIKAHPGQSVGVITFNIQQRDLIEEMWNDRLDDDPELAAAVREASEGQAPFIKNLESVQGDERDVILFSVGFGPDEYDTFSMNFGPVNKKGGHRRLNVAVSRARLAMDVYASFNPEIMQVNPQSPRGVADLRDFLAYARDGGSALKDLPVPEENERMIRNRAIADALEEKGYAADINVGSSAFKIDVAVRDPQAPEQYLLAVIFDDDACALDDTVRDRMLLQKDMLARMGWQTMNLWLLDWWQDEASQIRKIEAELKRIEKG